MKTILLTGGSGFIGRNVKESFLSEKYRILSPSSKELNCFDEDAVDDFFAKNKIDIVIHAAGKPGHRNAEEPNNVFYSNTKMFLNLEKHSSEYEKMLVIGSGAIYDMRHYQPRMNEEYFGTHIPIDEHGLCKYTCGKIIEKSDNIIDLRVFGIFGKYEDYAIRFISNMICKSIFEMPLTMHQNRIFSYLFVDDLIPVLDYFIENKVQHKAYNIVPNETFELKELAELVIKITGKNLDIIKAKEGFGLAYSGDNSRLKEEMPHVKFTNMTKAIETLYNWYNENKKLINRDFLMIDK